MVHYFKRIDPERRPGSGDPGLAGASGGPEMNHYGDFVAADEGLLEGDDVARPVLA